MSMEANHKASDGARHAIILAGGSGTRLWPMSRALLPKQLLAINGEATLLQQTVARALETFPLECVHVVTHEEHRFAVVNQLMALDPALEGQVLAEPMRRNTLPAIMLGLEKVVDRNPDGVTAVFPSDHFIGNSQGWKSSLERAETLARQGFMVTFAIPTTHPETGYGYILKGEPLGDAGHKVGAFVEKPDLELAATFHASPDHYFNSGMFMFKAETLLAEVEAQQEELAGWWGDRGQRSLVDGYSSLPDVSIDYGVMEHASKIAMVEASFDWDDLGNWEALHRMGAKDESGCVTSGDVLALDCVDSLLFSSGGKLACVGLDKIIAVQTRDATLVCHMDQVQKVKQIVDALKAENSQLVEAHVTVNRPWGSYTVLEEGDNYKIKRITVNPGETLSLQMHHHRSEHWVVIKGTARVRVGDEEILLAENESVDIPKTAMHRLANPGKVLVEIIEIQSGPYLEEDDIVRFEDVYGRTT